MSLCNDIIKSISTVILDKEPQIKLALCCILAQGHLLIEDLPGMGKTTLAKALAETLGLSWQRVQFTADMLPGDLLGTNIYNEETKNFSFHEGPVFTNMLLADEINRGSPRTQSALLEAMAEHQVSLDKVTYKLPNPFFVIATQNPLDQAGTFPLPESQLDRFMLKIQLGFPAREQEIALLKRKSNNISLPALTNARQLLSMQQEVTNITCSNAIFDYIMNLVSATRDNPDIPNPLSPRAALALVNVCKAYAYINNRDYVTPEDVQIVFPHVAEHRIRKGNISSLNNSTYSNKILHQINPVL